MRKMCEILFRGKRTNDGKWVEGVPIPVEENTYPTGKIELVKSVNYDELDSYIPLYESDEVIPETVGQHTGLSDRNGTKIFDGDIIRYSTKEHFGIYGVSWNNESACFGVYGSGLGRKTLIGDFTFFDSQKCDVIGNIYDNPSLLK